MTRRPLRIFALLFCAGLLATAIGAFLDPRRLAFSWLAAFAACASTALGALVLVAIAHAARARWIVAVRRLLEIPMAALPAFLLLLVPILACLGDLYPWVDPAPALPAAELAAIEHRRGWLQPAFFAVRAFLYLGLWSGFALALGRGSIRLDQTGDAALHGRLQRISAAALPLLVLAATFAAFDWLMSLQPAWLSTIFGIYWLTGGLAAAVALLALLLPLLREEGLENHRIAVGKLLLALVICWAYVAFMQLLLIWIADLPHEVDFYRRRSAGGWSGVSTALALLHFAIPFLLLLSRPLKAKPRLLAGVGAIVLLGHLLDGWWLVLPVLDPEGPRLHLLDLGAFATVAGAAGLFACWRLQGAALIASGDPWLASALRYRGS